MPALSDEGSTSLAFPSRTESDQDSLEDLNLDSILISETDPIDGNASPLKPRVSICTKFLLESFEVA